MNSKLYSVYGELGKKQFGIEDRELLELHRLASLHLEEAIIAENDEERLAAERDYELDLAIERLDTFDAVDDYDKGG